MVKEHRAHGKAKGTDPKLAVAAPLLELKAATSELRQLHCAARMHQDALEEPRASAPCRPTKHKLKCGSFSEIQGLETLETLDSYSDKHASRRFSSLVHGDARLYSKKRIEQTLAVMRKSCM